MKAGTGGRGGGELTSAPTTTELPIVTGHPSPGARDDEEVDRWLATTASAESVRPKVLGERILGWVHQITATRLGAAACAVWVFAVIVGVVSWAVQPTVNIASGSTSRIVANCGLDSFFYGYPDPAVQSACRHAEAAPLSLFILSVVVVSAGALAAILSICRRAAIARPGPLSAPLRLVPWLFAVAIAAVVVGVLALRPAPAQMVQAGQLTNLRCGIDTYLFGYPDHAVQDLCHRAYDNEFHVVLAAVLIGATDLVILGWVLTRTSGRWPLRRTLTLALALGLAVASLIALRPVTVSLRESGGPVVVNCGLDVYIAGYPDRSVQSACRHSYTSHAATGLGLAVLSLLVLLEQRSFAAKLRVRGPTESGDALQRTAEET